MDILNKRERKKEVKLHITTHQGELTQEHTPGGKYTLKKGYDILREGKTRFLRPSFYIKVKIKMSESY